MMSKIFRLVFRPYVNDEYGAYYHSGVGYTGVTFNFRIEEPARIKHSGVGYTGVYID